MGSSAPSDGPSGPDHRVFVLWAHTDRRWSEERVAQYKKAVYAFAQLLDKIRGLHVEADLFHYDEKGIDFTRWGPQQVEDADTVLMVSSDALWERWSGQNPPDEGAGAARETDALHGLFDDDQAAFQRKVLIVVLPGGSAESVPHDLSRVQRIPILELSDQGLNPLLRRLLNKPRFLRQTDKTVPDLPPHPPPDADRPDDSDSGSERITRAAVRIIKRAGFLTAYPATAQRRTVLALALFVSVAVIVATIWGPRVIRHLTDGMRHPPSARLSIVNSQVVYLPSEDDNLGSVIDMRLRNDGGSTAQVHRLTVVVEKIERYPYRPCAQGCLPHAGSQAAVIYSVPLDRAQAGQTIVRDVGLTVEHASVERMALAFAGTTSNTCTVARLKVSLEADGQPQTDPVTSDILMVTGPPKGQARQLTDHQLELTLQDVALPVLTTKDVRAELTGRSLPIPTWLGAR
jgi:hypothetical protein